MPFPRAARRSPDRRPLRSARRRPALLAVAALAGGLLLGVAVPAAADPAPPPNPSDAQIGAAQASKAQLATQVGQLTAQLSQIQVQVQQLQAASELAEQKYALAVQQLQQAKDAATAAKQDVVTAQQAVDAARTAFDAAVRANYQQGAVQGGPGALLASSDPEELLQSGAYQAYVTSHQADGIGRLDRAKVDKANADARARSAVDAQTTATTNAESAYTAARAAQTASEQQQQALAAQTASTQAQLDTAQSTLLGLQNQRAAYDAWVAQQAAIKAAQEAAREAAMLAARPTSQGGGGGGGGGFSSGGGAGNPTGGSWTAARGQDAVNRAMAYLHMRYSFAAGNFSGPTYGVCGSDDDGWNDCHVFGFDCSGLALYAWAPYLHMDHYAATQYTQAGSYHPSTGDLQPGDLVFWSSNGTIAGIHHVAIYIGGGNVIQAPHSGDVVKITNVFQVDSGLYGATRPLT